MTERLSITRPELLDDLTLQRGSHPEMGREKCFMEAFSQLTGQQFTSRPYGVETTICYLLQNWNDCLDVDDAARARIMKPLFVEIMNTAPSNFHWHSNRVSAVMLQGHLRVIGWAKEENAPAMVVLIKQLCAMARADLAEYEAQRRERVHATEAEVWALADKMKVGHASLHQLTNATFAGWTAKPKLTPLQIPAGITWSDPCVDSWNHGLVDLHGQTYPTLNNSLTLAGVANSETS